LLVIIHPFNLAILQTFWCDTGVLAVVPLLMQPLRVQSYSIGVLLVLQAVTVHGSNVYHVSGEQSSV